MCIYVNSYRVVFPSPYQYHFHSQLAARCGSSYPILRSIIYSQRESMEKNHRRQSKSKSKAADDEEVSSIEWESIVMSEQEEDLIYRMHKLVGDRWDLIAGRIPGRTAEQVERFWIMRHRHGDGFAYAWRREEAKPKPKPKRAKYGVFIR